MPLQKLLFKPGINKEATDYANEGGWVNSNLVRFRKGLPEKIGGWAKATSNSFKATGRALHAWVALEGTKYLGLGTTWKYYVVDGIVFSDVTPIRSTTASGDVTFAATDGSSTLTVTDTAHGAVAKDFVTFSGAVGLGGTVSANNLNQEYQILTVTTNTYTITAKDTNGDTVTANSSDSGNGGSSVVGTYQLNVGLDVYIPSTGWGSDTWGAGTWGSVTSLESSNQLRLWSHDNFGEDLVMNPRGSGVFYWDESNGTGTRAIALSSLSGANLTPTRALQVMVSDVDRHVICFGADPLNDSSTARTGAIDPMFIAWSDQENITQWEPLPTNTAGSFRLSAGSAIVGALRARQETLIWTDTSLYSMTFVGQPFTFSINLVNEGVGLVGPNAMVNTPKGVFWMDKKGFYSYAGAIKELSCSVDDYVFSDLNQTQSFQIFGFVNKAFNEVGWFYCSADSNVIDRYVTYNYEENIWMIGELSRTCWLDEGIFSDPKATSSTDDVGYLFNHETGNDDDDTAMTNVFIESADFDLGEGDFYQSISRIIPDVKFTGSASTGANGQTVDIVLKRRNFPGEELTTAVTGACTSVTTKIDTRARGRQAVLRVQSNDTNANDVGMSFRLGATRIDTKPDGMR
ncbi:MAG: hypothetical protein CBC57_01800 [Euryarchaeota archaeon TMED97]|nr:MAG: hypothetical protein CBC57_01800 [Euryarchaeota archaeon TMED97]|tara:strand:- start:5223 stop:7112 length:1890 start_codon:yes stop_codon:yes gene_type:complete